LEKILERMDEIETRKRYAVAWIIDILQNFFLCLARSLTCLWSSIIIFTFWQFSYFVIGLRNN
jgi:hypothetical protein